MEVKQFYNSQRYDNSTAGKRPKCNVNNGNDMKLMTAKHNKVSMIISSYFSITFDNSMLLVVVCTWSDERT